MSMSAKRTVNKFIVENRKEREDIATGAIIEKVIESSEMEDFIGMIENLGLLDKVNYSETQKEFRKSLIILSANYWHSDISDKYHMFYDCNHSNDIEADNIMPGKGGKKSLFTL